MKGTRQYERVIWEKGAVAEKRFLPFYFRVRAFSIPRTRLPRSLEQATATKARAASYSSKEILLAV